MDDDYVVDYVYDYCGRRGEDDVAVSLSRKYLQVVRRVNV